MQFVEGRGTIVYSSGGAPDQGQFHLTSLGYSGCWDKDRSLGQVLRFYLSKDGEMLVRPSVHELRRERAIFQGFWSLFWPVLAFFCGFQGNLELILGQLEHIPTICGLF